MEPRFEVQLKILKPVGEVFEAVVDPARLSGYFTKAASGRLVAGDTVQWSASNFVGSVKLARKRWTPAPA